MNVFEISTSSKSNEWYTPENFISLVRREFDGHIDLDPASCETANRVIQAKKIYTKETNGLDKEWCGNVFVNPPYGKTGNKSNQSIWLNKAINEHSEGNKTLVLLNARFWEKWFFNVYSRLDDVILLYTPLAFWNESRSGEDSKIGQMVCTLGFKCQYIDKFGWRLT